ncbi:hypothetical protein J2X31_000098 [Flavobacterium arsenatis]|uniref:Uncharacterized protein n=1 Tax=Flavobacterium arsenatis TaxID=1484332 RepID=A0ABU1TJF4_9FLAO|nr:hypothetical protein [Flavobacterium arsenatis]MDR6966105.1 hypothetical protein [Flavobacterium arsenatis]
MKITIQPFTTVLPVEEKTALYNILKRCEEDLLRRNPDFTDVILELKQVPVLNSSLSVRHSLLDDETKLKIVLNFNKKPPGEKLYDVINKELNIIKKEL